MTRCLVGGLSDTRELFINTVSVLLQNVQYVRAFESNQTAQQLLLVNLMRAFIAGRSWMTVTTVISRFWRGLTFGVQTAKPFTSALFRNQFRSTVTTDTKLFDDFLNQLFNQLNWAATEFDTGMKEVLSPLIGSPSPV